MIVSDGALPLRAYSPRQPSAATPPPGGGLLTASLFEVSTCQWHVGLARSVGGSDTPHVARGTRGFSLVTSCTLRRPCRNCIIEAD